MLPHRSVITEGELDVSSGPHKCNWAILFNDIIAFCNEGKNRAVLTHFSLDYSWVVDLSDVGPSMFTLTVSVLPVCPNTPNSHRLL